MNAVFLLSALLVATPPPPAGKAASPTAVASKRSDPVTQKSAKGAKSVSAKSVKDAKSASAKSAKSVPDAKSAKDARSAKSAPATGKSGSARKPSTARRRTVTPRSVRRHDVPDRREREAQDDQRWHFRAGVSAVADSNINHTNEALADYGAVGSAAAEYRRTSGRNTFGAHYEIAQHQYVRTDAWNRTSQDLQGFWAHKLSSALRTRTLGEIQLKGSSEDRDLADRYSLRQELDWKLTGHDTLTAALAARWKRYDDNARRDSANPYAGLEYEHEWSDDHSLGFRYRYEHNRAQDPRYTYRRMTLGTSYTVPVGRNTYQLEARYKPQWYDRKVEVNDRMVGRKDRRWMMGATWTREVRRDFVLETVYEYERRASNDPDKSYAANLLSFTLLKRW